MGLEVHVELNTATKMFCGCSTVFGAEPNTQVCPVCLGLPGALPALNRIGVESAMRIGLALNCQVAEWCRFARKNYFYPDMPKNFQTSQYDEPICFDGYLDVDYETPEGRQTFRVGIERAHMEEDTGKNSHMGGATGRIHGADYSLVDYNRAGHPADRDRHQADRGGRPLRPRGRQGLCRRAARAAARAGRLGRADGAGVAALRRQPVAAPRPGVCLRHPFGDQERQLAALGRAGGALRDRPAGRAAHRGRQGRPGDPALARGHRADHLGAHQGGVGGLPLLPGAGPRPDRPVARVGRAAARDPAGEPGGRVARGSPPSGASPTTTWPRWSTPGRWTSSRRPSPQARDQASARKWWTGELSRIAKDQGVELADLSITPAQVAELESLVVAGHRERQAGPTGDRGRAGRRGLAD